MGQWVITGIFLPFIVENQPHGWFFDGIIDSETEKSYNTTMLHERMRKIGSLSWERNTSHSQFIDLTNPSYGEYGMLTEDACRSQGRATVVVHPFYGKYEGIDTFVRYKWNLRKTLAASTQSQEPVIIFESGQKVKELQKKLSEKRLYYLIQTMKDDPAPLLDEIYESGGYDFGPISKDMALDIVSKRILNAGVHTVSIAGRYYFVDPVGQENEIFFRRMRTDSEMNSSAKQWTEQSLYPDGCVGAVIRSLLRNGIAVELTKAVAPNAPKPLDIPFS